MSDVEQDLEDGRAHLVDAYVYEDASGNPLFEVGRVWWRYLKEKNFYERRPGGKWENEVTNVRRVLYRLPRVYEAAKTASTVFLVEGEKDVHTMERLGFVATTSSGQHEWLDHYAEALAGADVVAVPDNDEVGREYVNKAIASLNGRARSTELLELSGLSEAEDVTDWVEKHGGSRERLLSLISDFM